VTTARRGVAAALLVVLAFVSAAAAEPCPDCLLAGAATVNLPVPAGAPLAGYGSWARRLTVPDFYERFTHTFWFKPHIGVLDPVVARALVLESAATRVVWIAADLIAVDQRFTARIKRGLAEAGVRAATLLLSASHTHSGPGAFLDSAVLAAVSVDREDPEVRDALVGAIVEAVRRAEASKSAAHIGIFAAPGPALTTGRLGQPVDQTLGILKIVTPARVPIAVLWNYAIHGTMLGPRNLKLSGDVMGLAAHRIERELRAPALFVNGAVGDVSPARHGLAEAEKASGELAAAVLAGWSSTPTTPRAPLRTATMTLTMHEPRLSLRNCVARWLPPGLALPLGRAFPPQTELVAVAVGRTAWVTIPGELQSVLGESVKLDAASAWERVLVAGLSNDYLGYFLTVKDAAQPSYVACANIYGPGAGNRVSRAAVGLLRHLADGEGH
jgi:neutral ceramidase